MSRTKSKDDWIIDLGPESGDKPVPSKRRAQPRRAVEGGGEVVAAGTPEAVAKEPRSYTGAYLKPLLAGVKERVAAE